MTGRRHLRRRARCANGSSRRRFQPGTTIRTGPRRRHIILWKNFVDGMRVDAKHLWKKSNGILRPKWTVSLSPKAGTAVRIVRSSDGTSGRVLGPDYEALGEVPMDPRLILVAYCSLPPTRTTKKSLGPISGQIIRFPVNRQPAHSRSRGCSRLKSRSSGVTITVPPSAALFPLNDRGVPPLVIKETLRAKTSSRCIHISLQPTPGPGVLDSYPSFIPVRQSFWPS